MFRPVRILLILEAHGTPSAKQVMRRMTSKKQRRKDIQKRRAAAARAAQKSIENSEPAPKPAPAPLPRKTLVALIVADAAVVVVIVIGIVYARNLMGVEATRTQGLILCVVMFVLAFLCIALTQRVTRRMGKGPKK